MKPRRVRPVLFLTALALLASTALAQVNRTLYDAHSPYQRISVIQTPAGMRQMIFDGRFDGTDAVQSEMSIDDPTALTLAYSRHMIAALPLSANPRRILVVGLGGACIQRYVHKLLPDVVIDTAELDPDVLVVANRFFEFREDARQKVHIGDGRKFIEESKDKYDIIMLDAFSATSIPYPLSTKEFLVACKARLNDGGLLAANLWYEPPTYHDMVKTYAEVFPEWHVLRCPQSTNNILVAFPEKRELTSAKWMTTARAYEATRPTSLDLPRLIDFAYQTAPRIPDNAKVLLDKDGK